MPSLESWIDDLQAAGRYSFQRTDALQNGGLSPQAASKALQRSVKSGRLIKLKDYFYVIVPLEYRAAGSLPPTWYIDALMMAMKLPYYVCLLSAAALHGSSHQQPQLFQVMTDRSVRAIRAGRTHIQFFASKYIGAAATTQVKAPTGAIRVATPETTAVDLVRFVHSAGGLDNVATVISELSGTMDPTRLLAAVRAVEDIPDAQRLGYILDLVRQRRLSEPLHAWLRRKANRLQPLRPDLPVDGASHQSRRWSLAVNADIEVET